MTLFVTSSPYIEGAPGAFLSNTNGFVDRIREVLPENPRALFICSDPDDHRGTCRFAAETACAFALEGITSLSVKPIRMIAALGVLVFLASLGVLIYSVIRKILGVTVPGWAFLAVSIWALGGIQLLSIGIIGEYIGKIYLETKRRPRFIISEYLKDD